MTIRLLTGDCRVTMATLPAASVQCVVTSPPYMGLRDYGTPPLVWGGDAEHEHAWNHILNPKPGGHGGWDGNNKNPDGTPRTSRYAGVAYSGATQGCACGAWLGSLGLEPTPDCGKRGRVRLRRDLTPAQREYVVRRLLGAAPRDAESGGTDGTK